jgi:Family of unknown function (DUF6350)
VPAARDGSAARRSLVPDAARRSLWLAAAWTGVGTAVVGAIVAIFVVAVLWLPASNGSGSAGSAIRAGLLTFLAALHGGITVDGLPAAFVPLGMTLALAAIAWRAGSGLAAAAEQLTERRSTALLRAGAIQTASFAVACGAAAHFATLGTSRVSALAASVAGLLVFAASGGVAFVRASALRELVSAWLPDWAGTAVRAAAAALTVYLAAGALLVAAALVLHHERVEALSREVGGGWSGVPILLLGVLAAPNAAVAGAAYLAGPGFALGSGSGVSLGSTVHGTLPAFPILGAVPSGPATVPVWLLAGATPFVAGACAARVAGAGATCGWRAALRNAAVAVVLVALAGFVLAWQGGGSIGSGRLSAFGASPWRVGLSVAGAVAVVATAAVGALALLGWWRRRAADEAGRPALTAVPADLDQSDTGDDAEADSLAG